MIRTKRVATAPGLCRGLFEGHNLQTHGIQGDAVATKIARVAPMVMCANGRGRFEIIRTKSRDYAWNKGWIEFEAPNAQGVYWLRTKDGLWGS